MLFKISKGQFRRIEIERNFRYKCFMGRIKNKTQNLVFVCNKTIVAKFYVGLWNNKFVFYDENIKFE